MVEEERLDSSPEREQRQRIERKNQVAAERDSGNESTSSQDKRKRQSQEDDNDNEFIEKGTFVLSWKVPIPTYLSIHNQ